MDNSHDTLSGQPKYYYYTIYQTNTKHTYHKIMSEDVNHKSSKNSVSSLHRPLQIKFDTPR